MKNQKFLKAEKIPGINPVDYFNFNVDWDRLTEIIKPFNRINNKYYYYDQEVIIEGNTIKSEAEHKILKKDQWYSKFYLLTVSLGMNHFAAYNHVLYKYMHEKLPYLRVGTDFYKLDKEEDRNNIQRDVLIPWKKDALRDDFKTNIIPDIPKYNAFCLKPSNLKYKQNHNGRYNLYAKPDFQASGRKVTEEDIPTTVYFLKHIFGDQFDKAIIYFKVLWESPEKKLPVIVLTSEERQTGKTTFMDYVSILCGNNFVYLNPADVTSQFNASYAWKNVIAIDETMIEKKEGIEKIKTLTTQQQINVNQKHVSNYQIPFYAKIMMATNRVLDFMKIDREENRFWIRKIAPFDKIITNILEKLIDEIPDFLQYLLDQPEVDYSKDRLVLTREETYNKFLEEVMDHSRSWLHKELEERFTNLFLDNDLTNQIYISPQEIKEAWFRSNGRVEIPYIRDVLTNEMKVEICSPRRYYSKILPDNKQISRRPFLLHRSDYACSFGVVEEESSNKNNSEDEGPVPF